LHASANRNEIPRRIRRNNRIGNQAGLDNRIRAGTRVIEISQSTSANTMARSHSSKLRHQISFCLSATSISRMSYARGNFNCKRVRFKD